MGRSFHRPGTPAAKYYAQLNAERHYTTSLAEDVDDYWSLRSHRRRQERGPPFTKSWLRLGWLPWQSSDVRWPERIVGFARGLTGDSGVLLRLDRGLHSYCHFDRTSDVISHSWITRTHTISLPKRYISKEVKIRLRYLTKNATRHTGTLLRLPSLKYNAMEKLNYAAQTIFLRLSHI